ncbi:MAG: 3-oxoacyl-[acyl-carrier-protein] reductase [Ardenticatenales bacterium]
MSNLTGRVALVTGSSRGIGRAVAERLARDGATVAVNYRSRDDEAAAVVAGIEAAGGTARAFGADVSDRAAAAGLVDATIEAFGRIDILVMNAGITRDALLMRMKDEDWDAVLETNLSSAFALARSAVKPMLRQRSGRIVGIASISGLDGNAGQANYAAAKAGLVGLIKSVAKEVGSRGITANAVAPGFIPTDLTADLSQNVLDQAVAHTALGRLGTADDVAGAVAFLVSDDAAFITGQVIRVDGGMTL